ncbi:hypothetical protein GJW-30_1_00393 [Variibacter gotjawalensis]|uniref:Uncharacterized protein n=1 Tax=Variibacter gotjawalensis TaxID=1333996 RepID=A0A0S3PPL0_9BRAD|nr:hypothetical protein [Variibacter gotjawalensis]NIK48180.1 hypothetical protein [Variibacter gotjawalensis]RZS50052.1 hypothetical protein EV661_2502 [Variibacter gotjawalensis]BAT57883.1 hypothetical protein GJW-30_1_00393 [Variibacter gotjawalensis]
MSYPLAVMGVLAAFLWPWLDELKGPGAFIVGDWTGSAQYRDMNFTFCAMSADREPWTIIVGIDRDDHAFVGFKHKHIKFREKDAIPGVLHIGPDDPGVPIKLTKVKQTQAPASETRATISDETADRLIDAKYFRLSSREIFADFETGSLRSAWPELKRCAITRGSR